MRKRIPGAPKFPKGLVRGSAEYKEWAAAYARAKRADQKTAYKPEPVEKVARAAVDLLLELASLYKKDEARIQIPEKLWPSFATLLRRSGNTATVQEADILRRVVSE